MTNNVDSMFGLAFGVLGAGIGSIASAGYNAATGYKTKRVKKKG